MSFSVPELLNRNVGASCFIAIGLDSYRINKYSTVPSLNNPGCVNSEKSKLHLLIAVSIVFQNLSRPTVINHSSIVNVIMKFWNRDVTLK